MIILFELRIKQRDIPRKLCSLRSAIITLGFIDFALFAPERLEYGEYRGRNESTRKILYENLIIKKKMNFYYHHFDNYQFLVLDRKKRDIDYH
jgi:hypothetical protein